MKKLNLLSKAEMKKVFGGVRDVQGCSSDANCSSGETCCPDNSGPTSGFKCQRMAYIILPNGEYVPDACGDIFIDV